MTGPTVLEQQRMSVQIVDHTNPRAVVERDHAVPAIECVHRKYQTAGRDRRGVRDWRHHAAPRRAIAEDFDVRRRRCCRQSHDIHQDIGEIIQGVLRAALVDLTRLQREPEMLRVEGDAAFGVSDTDRGMVDAALGSRIWPRELDQLKRMPVGVAEFEGDDAAGQRLRAALRDGREGKPGEPSISRGDIVRNERACWNQRSLLRLSAG